MNSWQGAVTITESGLGERGKWVKFNGKARMNGTGRTRGVVWISTRGATGSGTPGYDLYIDDIVITDVTDAQKALDVADASTTAVSGLTTRVTNAETKITAHSQQITSLQSTRVVAGQGRRGFIQSTVFASPGKPAAKLRGDGGFLSAGIRASCCGGPAPLIKAMSNVNYCSPGRISIRWPDTSWLSICTVKTISSESLC